MKTLKDLCIANIVKNFSFFSSQLDILPEEMKQEVIEAKEAAKPWRASLSATTRALLAAGKIQILDNGLIYISEETYESPQLLGGRWYPGIGK
jgi:hypothetical protein